MATLEPRRLTGRARRRQLYRASRCGLCGRRLGNDRGLYRDNRPLDEHPNEYTLVAHPRCVADYEAAAQRRAEAQRAAMGRILNRAAIAVAAQRAGLTVVWR